MIAALYDIHGNLPALEAVLEEVRRMPVDRLVVGGDVVPGPMAGACLDRLLECDLPVDFLVGNGERDVLAMRRGEVPGRVPEAFRPLLRWAADELTTAQADEISGWPETVDRTIPGFGRTLFCHATPRDDNEIFTERTPEARIRCLFADTEALLVVCGHTHMQFDRIIGGVRVVNAGSVGMPFGDPGAYWLLVGPKLELRRTSYDYRGAAERIARSGYPGDFAVEHPPRGSDMISLFEAASVDCTGGT